MTLNEIKDQVCNEVFKCNYKDLVWIPAEYKMHEEIAQRYARECVKASLERAADNVKAKLLIDDVEGWMTGVKIQVNKSSITSDSNIVLL